MKRKRNGSRGGNTWKRLAPLLLLALWAGFYVYNHGWGALVELIAPAAETTATTAEADRPTATTTAAQEATAQETTAAQEATLADTSLLPAPRPDLPEQILKRKAYTVSYNKETRNANWVAWTLTRERTAELVERPKTSPFHEDDEVPDPKANRSDYKKSGWSRGHLCPAGDCRWDEEAMYESFLLTNVCPQAGKLNTGVWNQIEKSCRAWAVKYGEVMIVTGPIYFKKSKQGYIGANRVRIPDAFFKVVLARKDGDYQGIGFVCRNEDKRSDEAGVTSAGRKRSKNELYTHTIDEVERMTGYDFFPGLDDAVETSVEALADYEKW